MITDVDKRIITLGEEDEDLELLEEQGRSLYNMKKDIKIDSNNFGIKSYDASVKKMKRIKNDLEQKLNPLSGMYPCIKRPKVEHLPALKS